MDTFSVKRQQSSTKIECFTPEDRPYGLTYGQWTVRWWQWANSLPKAFSAVFDKTGRYAHINQEGPVWFLAGTAGENKIPERTCQLPNEKSILFPVINYEINELEIPELKTESQLIKHVIEDINDIVTKDAIVDGANVPIYRVRSDPPTFPLTIDEDNGLGIPGGHTQAAADGYWVFMKALPAGEHNVYFHGSCSGGVRTASANYHLRIA
jgi:hypothetical protein